jgi:membrane protein EpsK
MNQSAAASPVSARNVIRNVVLGAAQQAVSIGVAIVLTPLLLFRLGIEQYGVLVICELFSITGLFAYAEMGLQGALIRFLAGHHAAREHASFRQLLATGFVVFLGIGVACSLAVLAIAHLLFFRMFDVPPRFVEAVWTALYLYAATFPVQFAIWVLKAFYLSIHDFPRLKGWESLERALYLGVVAAVLARGGGIVAVITAEQIVTIGLGGVFAFVAAHRYAEFTADLRLFRASSLNGVVELGWRSFTNAVQTILAYQKGPEIVAASMLGPGQVGYLATLVKVPTALKTLGSAVTVAFLPAVAALERLEQRRQMALLTLRGIRYFYFATTPVLTFVAWFAPDILRMWVGPEFIPLANLLRVFILLQYAMFLVLLLRATFTQVNQFRLVAWSTLAGNIAFVIVAISLTLLWRNLWGVAIGLGLNVAIMLGGYLRVLTAVTPITPNDLWRDVVRGPMLSAGLGTLAAWAVLSLVAKPSCFFLGASFVFVLAAATWLILRYALAAEERAQLLQAAARLVGRASESRRPD